MARSATKRALRVFNDGASSVAGSVKSGTKLVVAALPSSKPTKLARLRGAVINRKVLIPAAVAVGVGALGYSAYRFVTKRTNGSSTHFPGLDGVERTDQPPGAPAIHHQSICSYAARPRSQRRPRRADRPQARRRRLHRHRYVLIRRRVILSAPRIRGALFDRWQSGRLFYFSLKRRKRASNDSRPICWFSCCSLYLCSWVFIFDSTISTAANMLSVDSLAHQLLLGKMQNYFALVLVVILGVCFPYFYFGMYRLPSFLGDITVKPAYFSLDILFNISTKLYINGCYFDAINHMRARSWLLRINLLYHSSFKRKCR